MFLSTSTALPSAVSARPLYICFAHSRRVLVPPRLIAVAVRLVVPISTRLNMGNGEIFNGHGYLTLQKALELVRETESGVDRAVYAFLQHALHGVWSKLLAQPEDYILTRDEFGLLNYFRQQCIGNEVAAKAVQRFWDHYWVDAANIPQ